MVTPSRGRTEVRALKQHDHACWVYRDADERAAVLGDFFAEGLAARERLLYFGSGDEAAIQASLGPELAPLIDSGTLTVADVEQAYFPDGGFDAAANLDGFRAMARQAVADGFTGIRVVAENAAVLNHPAVGDSWFDYELQVDAVVAAEPIVGLCAFDSRELDEQALALLDAVHLLQHATDSSAPRSAFHLHTMEPDVLVLTGDVDAFDAPGFTRLLNDSVRRRERLQLDIRSLRFVDAAGLTAIEQLSRQRPPDVEPLEVRGLTPFQLRVWGLIGDPESVQLVDA